MELLGLNIYTISMDSLSKLSYLDIDRKACFIPNDGFSKVVRKFDDNGYIINQTFYDVDGNQCLSNDGNSSAKYINDNRGNVQEMWFYGLDGKTK